ncbi:crotonobetainyl-CoA:carnitine CoA-transferase CaiB-like acyl-CoA transferase [Azospirillum agricola]|uniref:CaiB/BaiF CoA transferase family protein n=1 Tax=Azospirillum agricola TaxID=1720247 RepID=UPI001AEA4901|nr:CoA transferase [Azospirillum agricola]MBP2229957.1 crotonobetainyl-CoA:carnitine CoA-transferase CaiB-like acyl-CoA transferase [Azospirillum agricola]
MLPMDTLPDAPDAAPFGMLAGVRVLDLTTSVAGPYASQLLGDFGADVIKVERPGHGDDARAWGPPFLNGESLWFLSVNRNKRSLTLDYTRPEGRAILFDLARHADVVVVNMVQRTQDKLGISYETLSAVKPELIVASITGFGLKGKRADLPCYDLIAEGYSGVMDLTGEPDTPPQKVGTPAADMLAGQDAALAVCAALLERARTGRGRKIDVSLVESMTRFMTPRVATYLGSGELPRRSGGRDSVIAVYQVFDTADRPMTVGLGNDGIWRRFCTALGQPDWAAEPRYGSNAHRREARPEIVAGIQERLRARPRAEWLALLAEAKVPAGPINRLDEVAADPDLLERGLFYALPHGADGGSCPQVNLGIHVDGAPAAPRLPPPRLGEHTRAILGELVGCAETDLASLSAAGII